MPLPRWLWLLGKAAVDGTARACRAASERLSPARGASDAACGLVCWARPGSMAGGMISVTSATLPRPRQSSDHPGAGAPRRRHPGSRWVVSRGESALAVAVPFVARRAYHSGHLRPLASAAGGGESYSLGYSAHEKEKQWARIIDMWRRATRAALAFMGLYALIGWYQRKPSPKRRKLLTPQSLASRDARNTAAVAKLTRRKFTLAELTAALSALTLIFAYLAVAVNAHWYP